MFYLTNISQKRERHSGMLTVDMPYAVCQNFICNQIFSVRAKKIQLPVEKWIMNKLNPTPPHFLVYGIALPLNLN